MRSRICSYAETECVAEPRKQLLKINTRKRHQETANSWPLVLSEYTRKTIDYRYLRLG